VPRKSAPRPKDRSTVRPERLAAIRALCLSLPEATEKEAWGDPTWRVRDKIFAMQKGNHAEGRPSLWFKGAEGVQERLVRAHPARFFVPPYVGHAGWIGLYLDGDRLDEDEMASLVRESYRRIAPKSLASRVDPA
jgi:predicted DNA-binding protein (MmcQ/YjbR family)